MSDNDRLSQALAFANYRQTLNNQILKLKIRTEGLLSISKNGGTFSIDRNLICFLDFLVRTEAGEATVIDNNGLPILITDVGQFLEEVKHRYFEVTSDYYKEYQDLRKSRNVKSILDLKD